MAKVGMCNIFVNDCMKMVVSNARSSEPGEFIDIGLNNYVWKRGPAETTREQAH
jgi:hypothetical protein